MDGSKLTTTITLIIGWVPLVSIPSLIFAPFFIEKIGLRFSLSLSIVFIAFACFLRTLTSGHGLSLVMAHVSSIINAFAGLCTRVVDRTYASMYGAYCCGPYTDVKLSCCLKVFQTRVKSAFFAGVDRTHVLCARVACVERTLTPRRIRPPRALVLASSKRQYICKKNWCGPYARAKQRVQPLWLFALSLHLFRTQKKALSSPQPSHYYHPNGSPLRIAC